MITARDINVYAQTICGEASGEDVEGKFLVAEVILNRWQTSYRGKKSLADVCLDPWQFSCWNEGDPNRKRILNLTVDDKIFRECMAVGLMALDAQPRLPKLTRHYCTIAATDSGKVMWLTDEEVPVRVNGNHNFYENIA